MALSYPVFRTASSPLSRRELGGYHREICASREIAAQSNPPLEVTWLTSPHSFAGQALSSAGRYPLRG